MNQHTEGTGGFVPRARRGLASALRWAADRLRDEVEIPPSSDAEVSAHAVTPAPAVTPEPVVAAPVEVAEPVPAPAAAEVPADAPSENEVETIRGHVISAMHTIFDPEIPVDIYELGLIYGVDVRPDRSVGITMTLTSPNCPAAQSLPAEVEVKAASVPGVDRADVEVVFEPPWTPDLMSEEAKLELNIG